MNGLATMADTVRDLRADGRSRATLGPWHVTIGRSYATFEHEDDREKRLTAAAEKAKAKPRRPRRRR